ncbi:MAG: nitrite reductase small subunit NirD [Nocardioidaceae bacterium]
MGTTGEWTKVCALDDLPGQRGVTALVHGQAIALFRTEDGVVYALGNHDPFSKESVLAKGIVGMRDGVPFVASTRNRHAFDLRTGRCLDDEGARVPAYDVKVVDGFVHVGPRSARDREAQRDRGR